MQNRIIIFFLLLIIFPHLDAQENRKEALREKGEYGTEYIIYLVLDRDSLPDFYFSHIRTPVCNDGLCKAVDIDMKWNLSGEFLDFSLPSEPLTKFDHEEFTDSDYRKLRSILRDKSSLLGRYRPEDLVDENSQRISETADAITGATLNTVREAVVEGALYTCHSLWNLANGKLTEKMKKFTTEILDEHLLRKLLLSSDYPDRYLALDNIPPDAYGEYFDLVFSYIRNSDVFVARYALEKMPGSVFLQEEHTGIFVSVLPEINYSLQNIILSKLKIASFNPDALYLLIADLDDFNREQVILARDIILDNVSLVSAKSQKKLKSFLDSEKPWLKEAAAKILEHAVSEKTVK